MRNILVIGAGGVGSWLAWFLQHYYSKKQLAELSITIADGDEVDTKNLLYQKFDTNDILENKATVLANKYKFPFKALPEYVNDLSFLAEYDCVICAVDSSVFRKSFFQYVFKINPNIYWIDLRSESRTIAAYAKHKKNTYDTMIETLPKTDVTGSSCQFTYELNSGIVQGGNMIVASIGAQMILNWYRDDINISSIVKRF